VLGELSSGLRRARRWQRAVAWQLTLVALAALIAVVVAGATG
jgi:hypothetical protein